MDFRAGSGEGLGMRSANSSVRRGKAVVFAVGAIAAAVGVLSLAALLLGLYAGARWEVIAVVGGVGVGLASGAIGLFSLGRSYGTYDGPRSFGESTAWGPDETVVRSFSFSSIGWLIAASGLLIEMGKPGTPPSSTEPAQAFSLVGLAIFVLTALSAVPLIRGRLIADANGIRFTTLFGWSSLPWSVLQRIEVRGNSFMTRRLVVTWVTGRSRWAAFYEPALDSIGQSEQLVSAILERRPNVSRLSPS